MAYEVRDIRVRSPKHEIDETFAGVRVPLDAEGFDEVGGPGGGEVTWDELATTQWETRYVNTQRGRLVMEKVGKVPGLRDLMAKIKSSGKSVEEILEILEQLS